MYSENSKADDQSSALITKTDGLSETTIITGVFHFECVGADGVVKWTDNFPNQVRLLVVTTCWINTLQVRLIPLRGLWDWLTILVFLRMPPVIR